MIIDYNEIVGFLEEFAHDVYQEDVSRVYAVLSFVSELASQHGETLENVNALIVQNDTLRKQIAQGAGKYEALHDYCAVVEAERAELRQRNAEQGQELNRLANAYANLVLAKILSK